MKISIIYKVKFFSTIERNKFKAEVKNLINKILIEEAKKINTLNIVLCDDVLIREYNKEYLGHDYETDIITFHDADEGGIIEGELLISKDTVEYNSKKFKVKFYEELLRVVIHGVLHLCGYDDTTDALKRVMKKKENYYLKYI